MFSLNNIGKEYHFMAFMIIVFILILLGVFLTIGFNKSISDKDDEQTKSFSYGISIFVMVLAILFMFTVIISNRNNKIILLGYELNKGMIIYMFIAFMLMFSSKLNS